jgi:hypothetical protein
VPQLTGIDCTAKLFPGKTFYEHVIPDGLGGEPTAENGAALCFDCWRAKTRAYDVPQVARAKRVSEKQFGVRKSKTPLPAGRHSRWKRKLNGKVVLR